MSVETLRTRLQQHHKALERLQREKAQAMSTVAAETRRAQEAGTGATRSSNLSTIRSRLAKAQRHQDVAARAQKKVADIESRIGREQQRQNNSQSLLSKAEAAARKKADRAERERAKRLDDMAATLDQHAGLHEAALAAIDALKELPARLTILFLAASPVDQDRLRLDEEAREIREKIRASQHRDAIALESRWAVRPLDILQAINETNPRIIHFSGHGTREALAFQSGSGRTRFVSKGAMAETLAASAGLIQLAVFNTCYSRAQAEAVVEHLPFAIGMNTSIGDKAARTFSAQLYNAIGFGHSVGTAFAQARAALLLKGLPEDSAPELFAAEGLDPAEICLVAPTD